GNQSFISHPRNRAVNITVVHDTPVETDTSSANMYSATRLLCNCQDGSALEAAQSGSFDDVEQLRSFYIWLLQFHGYKRLISHYVSI
ncbi:hypothetical protein Tco_0501362, partial [Tanacetum coccineum]